jgi:YHS domain-containing protein
MTIFLLTLISGLLPDDGAVNEYCPVLTEERAQAEYSILYKGRRVRFCCPHCRTVFAQSPEQYAPNLPGGTAFAGTDTGTSPSPWTLPGLAAGAGLLALALGRHRRSRNARLSGILLCSFAAASSGSTALLGTLVELQGPDGIHYASAFGLKFYLLWGLVHLLAGLVAAVPERLTRVAAVLRARRIPIGIAGAVVAVLGLVALRDHHGRIVESRKDVLHNTTFTDYGEPPVPPLPPPAQLRLGGTWYRGNDERDPSLFNGGNYRTCRVDLSLEDAAGKTLHRGDPTGSGPLRIRLHLLRSSHTREYLYSEAIMRRCFLTRSADPFMGSSGPVADRTPIVTVRPLWEWTCAYPMEPAPRDGRLRGVVYVCEDLWMPATEYYLGRDNLLDEETRSRVMLAGARFHLGLPYDLWMKDGVLEERSTLLAAALYHSRKFNRNRLEEEEWFGVVPIPEIAEKGGSSALPASPDRDDR